MINRIVSYTRFRSQKLDAPRQSCFQQRRETVLNGVPWNKGGREGGREGGRHKQSGTLPSKAHWRTRLRDCNDVAGHGSFLPFEDGGKEALGDLVQEEKSVCVIARGLEGGKENEEREGGSVGMHRSQPKKGEPVSSTKRPEKYQLCDILGKDGGTEVSEVCRLPLSESESC